MLRFAQNISTMDPKISWQVRKFCFSHKEISNYTITHHTNTFSFSLIRLFWRSVGLWGGEEVVVEPGGAARGDGAGHGDCSVNQFWLFPCYYSIFNVMLSLFVQESTQLRQFEGRFQSRCKSASLQSLCQVFKTWPCCQAEYQSWFKVIYQCGRIISK